MSIKFRETSASSTTSERRRGRRSAPATPLKSDLERLRKAKGIDIFTLAEQGPFTISCIHFRDPDAKIDPPIKLVINACEHGNERSSRTTATWVLDLLDRMPDGLRQRVELWVVPVGNPLAFRTDVRKRKVASREEFEALKSINYFGDVPDLSKLFEEGKLRVDSNRIVDDELAKSFVETRAKKVLKDKLKAQGIKLTGTIDLHESQVWRPRELYPQIYIIVSESLPRSKTQVIAERAMKHLPALARLSKVPPWYREVYELLSPGVIQVFNKHRYFHNYYTDDVDHSYVIEAPQLAEYDDRVELALAVLVALINEISQQEKKDEIFDLERLFATRSFVRGSTSLFQEMSA